MQHHIQQQWCGQVRPYSGFALVAGMILLAGACSSDVTAPKNSNSLAINASHGIPIPRDFELPQSVTFTGSSAVVGTSLITSVLQVSVTVKNDSTAPVSFGYGPCGLNFALYQNAAHSGNPTWQKLGVCQSISEQTVAADQSVTVTGSVPLTELAQVAAGTYYVTASTIYNVGNTNFPRVVDAGTVTIP